MQLLAGKSTFQSFLTPLYPWLNTWTDPLLFIPESLNRDRACDGANFRSAARTNNKLLATIGICQPKVKYVGRVPCKKELGMPIIDFLSAGGSREKKSGQQPISLQHRHQFTIATICHTKNTRCPSLKRKPLNLMGTIQQKHRH